MGLHGTFSDFSWYNIDSVIYSPKPSLRFPMDFWLTTGGNCFGYIENFENTLNLMTPPPQALTFPSQGINNAKYWSPLDHLFSNEYNFFLLGAYWDWKSMLYLSRYLTGEKNWGLVCLFFRNLWCFWPMSTILLFVFHFSRKIKFKSVLVSATAFFFRQQN